MQEREIMPKRFVNLLVSQKIIIEKLILLQHELNTKRFSKEIRRQK